jgi:large repetitive protein
MHKLAKIAMGVAVLVSIVAALSRLAGAQAATPHGLQFAQQSTGSGAATGAATAAFADGRFAVAGAFSGSKSFGPGATEVSTSGVADFFVALYNADATLAWVRTGGVGVDESAGATGVISIDADGSVVVSGSFHGTMPLSATPLTTSNTDLFIARYDSAGAVMWAAQSQSPAGTDGVFATGLASYPDGSVVATGNYIGTPTFGGTPIGNAAAAGGVFLARYGANGTPTSARSVVTATGMIRSIGVASVGADGAIATGWFSGTGTFGATSLTAAGPIDSFVARFAGDGSNVWTATAGGANAFALAGAVAAFGDGSAIVSGQFTGTIAIGSGASTLTAAGAGGDMFVARFNSDGSPAWATRGGAADGSANAAGAATYADGTSVVVGAFSTGTADLEFAPCPDGCVRSAGGADIFIARYGSTGALLSVRSAGGQGGDFASAVAAFPDRGALVAGQFDSAAANFVADQPPQTITLTTTTSDLFVARYDPYPVATTTAIDASPAASVWGESVRFTATVTPAIPGAGTPTGQVTFLDGSLAIGAALPDASGVARLDISSLAVGTHVVSAVYDGDSIYTGSTSTAVSQPVARANTTTILDSSVNPVQIGAPVTLIASVGAVAPGAGTPSGIVTFFEGASVLGTGVVAAGQATLTVPALSAGSHTITATYSGDGSFNGSVADPFVQVVAVRTAADVAVFSSAEDRSQSKGTLTYVIALVNFGPGTASNVVVKDVVPSGVSVVSATLGAGSCTRFRNFMKCEPPVTSVPCAVVDGAVTCAINALAPFTFESPTGMVITLVTQVSAPIGSTVSNTATVTAANPDPRPANNTSTTVVKLGASPWS